MTENKAVMISIKPEWCGYIFVGKKTDELRKDKPMPLECPFKVYIYCTKSGDKTNMWRMCGVSETRRMIGKVCAEFICDRMTYIQARKDGPMDYHLGNAAFINTGLSDVDTFRYIAGNVLDHDTFNVGGWAWHISQLKVYTNPKNIDEFKMYNGGRQAKRPPQSWFYVEEI